MDKYPDIFDQKFYQEKGPWMLNKDLRYNASGLLCDDSKLWTWSAHDLRNLDDEISFCQSKITPDRKIDGDELRDLLLRDFGFEGRKYMPESYQTERM